MEFGATGDRDSPTEGGSAGVNLASAAASAVGGAVKYFFRAGEGTGDKPREVRTGSDADWDMVDTPGDPVATKSPASRYEFDKYMNEKTKEIAKKDEDIRKLRSELTKAQQLAEERRIKLQKQRPHSDCVDSGTGSDVEYLQERIREQAQLVLKMKQEKEEQSQRMRELEETLEMAATDKSSFESTVQDAEDERDKVKDDFENAKEEIRALKKEVKQLNHELSLSKREAMEAAKRPIEGESGDCSNPKCKDIRINLNQLKDVYEKKVIRVTQLERIVDNLKKQNHELEVAKNEAAGDIAAAKMEAEIHKADFLEERKDRERAQGRLAELEEKAGGQSSFFHEERVQLYKELNDCKKENSKLKISHAQSEAKLESRIITLNEVVDNLTKQLETATTERDDARYEVERRKASKHQKIKEYDRMKQQLHAATKGNVRLVEQLEEVRKEKKDLLKMVKKEQDKQRKAEKKSKTSTHEHLSMTEAETPLTAAEELAALRSQIAGWKADIRHHQQMVKVLSVGIRDGTALFSPIDDEGKSLVSPTSDQQIDTATQNNPFLGDPNYVPSDDQFQGGPNYIRSSDPDPQPELPLRQQLEKLNQVKLQMNQTSQRKGASTGPLAPSKQEIQRGIEDAAGTRRSATGEQQCHNDRQSRGAKQGNSRPRSFGANSGLSCQSPVGNNQLPPSGSAATANKPPRAGVQGQPDQRHPSLKSQSSQDSSHPDLLRANPSPLLTRQSSHEPPPLRAGGTSSEPPLRAGGPSSEPPLRAGGPSSEPPLRAGGPSSVQPAPIQSHVTMPPHSEVVRHSNLPHADNSTRKFQKPAPYSAPQNVGGQQYMLEGAQAAQMQPHRAGGQQFQSEHAQTHPMTDPSVANVPPQQDDVSYQNVSAGARARDYGGSSAPVGHHGGQPPPSHVPSAQHHHEYNTESERPAVYYGEPGGGRPHGAQAEPLPRKPSSEPNPERISYPKFPEQKSNTETVETGTQMSISFTHPLIEKQPTGHGAKAKAAKRRGEEEEQENVLVEKIDDDIKDVAAGVREEVSEENECIMTMEHKPYDPNLVCPMCGKKHRIGEIQKFRKHVSECDGNIGDLV